MSTMPICALLLIVLINFTAGVSEVWQVLHAKDPEQGEIHVTGLVRQVQLARGQAGARWGFFFSNIMNKAVFVFLFNTYHIF